MKKIPSKVAHNQPPTFFLCTGPAAQTAQKQKSSTSKIPLMQDWVFRLGFMISISIYCFSDEEFLKETLLEVFRIASKETKQMKQWLLEIMGQVLFLLRQNCSVWTFNFMFEMFVLSLSALSRNFDDSGVNYKVSTYVNAKFLNSGYNFGIIFGINFGTIPWTIPWTI